MPDTNHSQKRIAIVGAGPAGATLATLLARDGMQVDVFERCETPSFGVGESLLPYGHRVWDLLGLKWDAPVIKRGAVFYRRGHQVRVDFRDAVGCPYATAYQVDRRILDPRLRELAREAGARLYSQDLKEVPQGYDWVVDASGRRRVFGRHFTTYEKHPVLRHIARGAHYRGGRLPDGCSAGDVAIVGEDGFWCWVIPLGGDVISVGAVQTGEARDLSWPELLEKSQTVRQAIEGAEMLDSPTGYADFTEKAARFCGDGWALVGDAALFLDPVFSSGVLFAMEGAERLHRVIRGDMSPAAYEAEVRESAQMMEAVVVGFYSGDFFDLAFFPEKLQSPQVREGLVGLLAGNLFEHAGRSEKVVARCFSGLARLARARVPREQIMAAPICHVPEDYR